MEGQEQTNGTSSKVTSLFEQRRSGRAQFLDALKHGGEFAEDEPVKPAPPARTEAPAPTEPKKPAPAPAAAKADDDEADEGDDEPIKPAANLLRDRRGGDDRDTFHRERLELERERAQHREALAKVEAFEKLAERAKYDPASVLRALGLTEDDFEAASRDIYAHSKAASADPKNREAALHLRRAREQGDQISQLQRELADMKRTQTQERERKETQKKLDKYFARVAKQASEKTPWLSWELANHPKLTQRKLARLAAKMSQKTGELPTEAELAARFEKKHARRMSHYGVNVSGLGPRPRKADKKPKQQSSNAPSQPTDRTATTSLSGTEPTSVKDRRALFVAAMESGQLD